MTFLKRGAALGLCLLSLGAAAPLRAEPFRFPWDAPEHPPAQDPMRQPPMRQAPMRPQGLTSPQVRSILAREGARLVGAPRSRGGETVAVGRDSDGTRRKFTLDADGRVVDIQILGTRESAPPREPRRYDDRRPGRDDDMMPPGQPMAAPRHSFEGPDDLPPPAPVEQAPGQPAARPAKSAPVAPPPPAPRQQPASPDASLSPIKPLRAPGAPRIEPLPQ